MTIRVTWQAMKQYFVYIMAGKSAVLYTGVTHNLERRVLQHKRKLTSGFTSRYNIDRLVYYESWPEILDAIAREERIKGWLRKKKVALIESRNPGWEELSAEWYGKVGSPGTVLVPGASRRRREVASGEGQVMSRKAEVRNEE